MTKNIRFETNSLVKESDDSFSFIEKKTTEEEKASFYKLDDVRGRIENIQKAIEATQYQKTNQVKKFNDTLSFLNAQKQFYEGILQAAVDLGVKEVMKSP